MQDYLGIEIVSCLLLLRMARTDMDESEKVGLTFLRGSACNFHQEKLLRLELSDAICAKTRFSF